MSSIDKSKFNTIGASWEEAEIIARPKTSYWKDAWRRLKENKVATISLVLLILIIIMIVIGPFISGYAFEEIDPTQINKAPTSEHWFGTDHLGRDLFARVWQAGRVSLTIGLFGAVISSIVGSIYGAFAAYFGGTVDAIMMRIVEILVSIPYLVVVILISVITDSSSIFTLMIALTLTGWCGIARIVRGQMLQIKGQEFVMAAETMGVSPFKIILKHLIPNTIGPIIVALTFDIPGYIFAEAFLSFIGLGVKPPATSWGSLTAAAQEVLRMFPYQLFFPAILIALTMLCFTLLGDGLRDALDPRMRK